MQAWWPWLWAPKIPTKMRVRLVGVRLMTVRMSLMRLLVVKKSMHGSLLLLLLKSTAWMHVRVAARVKAPILLSVHVHIEPEHLRLAQRAHAGFHGSRRASSVKTWAFIMGAHVQSRLVYVSLWLARVSAINLRTKLLQPKHTPLQSIPHDDQFARHRHTVCFSVCPQKKKEKKYLYKQMSRFFFSNV